MCPIVYQLCGTWGPKKTSVIWGPYYSYKATVTIDLLDTRIWSKLLLESWVYYHFETLYVSMVNSCWVYCPMTYWIYAPNLCWVSDKHFMFLWSISVGYFIQWCTGYMVQLIPGYLYWKTSNILFSRFTSLILFWKIMNISALETLIIFPCFFNL